MAPRSFLCGALLGACSGEGDPSQDPSGLAALEPADRDHDGAFSDSDCNDENASVFPGAPESCNGVDDDCDGAVDDGITRSYFRDEDMDEYGDTNRPASACAQPVGFVADGTDCDDENSEIHPGASEICDLVGADEDCNGLANELDPGTVDMRTWYVDADEDGFGSSKTVESCTLEPGLASVGTDCNDADPAISGAMPEVCDALDTDEDCDGFSDEDDPEGPTDRPERYYVDADGDGDGDASDPGHYFCDDVPPGYSTLPADCDDGAVAIHLGAPEYCTDAIDNDCDGDVDDCGPIADIALDTADTTLDGSITYGYTVHGYSVAGVRDMNGDGWQDFATSAPNYDSDRGAVWLFYGPMDAGTFDVDDVDVADAILEGEHVLTDFGWAIDRAGDLNEDGFDDLIIGTYYGNGAHLFLGPVVDDASSAAADATWSAESEGDGAGQSVAGGFDFDGDGKADYLIGAPTNDDGAVYVIYGPGTGSHDLSDASVKIAGSDTLGSFGQELTGVPDMDGDGVDEAAVGQWYAAVYTGETYLFYGASISADTTASSADATFTATSGQIGSSVGRATDLNGDGLGDLMIGAMATDTSGYNLSGSVYIVLGPGDTSGDIDALAQAELYGEGTEDYVGEDDMDGEMDVNRDGFTDILVGAANANIGTGGTTRPGAAYVVYGPQTGDVALADARCALTGTISYEAAGASVSFIGDQSGDGSPEVIVGAPYEGLAFIVWGERL